jgi:hypothetical protein
MGDAKRRKSLDPNYGNSISTVDLQYPYRFVLNKGLAHVCHRRWQTCADKKTIDLFSQFPIAGHGDMAININMLQACYKYPVIAQEEGGINLLPIVLSAADLQGLETIDTGMEDYKFCVIKRRSIIGCKGITIAIYACLLNYLSGNPEIQINWEQYLELDRSFAHDDFWLLFKKTNRSDKNELTQKLNLTLANLGFEPVATDFYIVDAVACISSVFSPYCREFINQFTTVDSVADVDRYPKLSLKWTIKHPGAKLLRNFIAHSIGLWEEYYGKPVLAEPPFSRIMKSFVDAEIIKGA